MKRILRLAGVVVLTVGLAPLVASADHQDPLHEVAVGDAAVGVEFTQGRTCVYAQKAEYGHVVVAISTSPEVRTNGAGEYDKHGDKTPNSPGDDSMCPN